MDTQTISITKARNEFFDLVMDIYRNGTEYIITKGKIAIPVVKLVPYRNHKEFNYVVDTGKKKKKN